MGFERTICTHCGSPDIKKAGHHFCPSGTYQKYHCNSCGVESTKRVEGVEKRQPPVQQIIPLPQEQRPIFWPAYNEAQVQEKLRFLELLGDLCTFIPEEEGRQIGRPRAGQREMTFCMVAKLYEVLSSRRVSSDLELAMQGGYISKVPAFTTILKYFNDAAMTPILESLIRLSSLPLRDFETTFAVDASGLSPAFYSRWLDERLNHDRKGWLKIHIICGVKSNIVTSIIVTDGHSNDAPHFPELVRATAENFRVKEVSADKAYSSKKNIEAVFAVGGIPYIPFKAGTTGRAHGSLAWQRMFYYYKLHEQEFLLRYHQRSNVESTFSMLKRKFSGKLMMKNEIAQVNEALAKLLCHNIVVLIRESCENGISTDFWQCEHLAPRLNINVKNEVI